MIPSFADFAQEARAGGFDDVLERTWPADAVLALHAHPFALNALVVRGEMWLAIGNETRHLVPGDRFALERDVPHAERYGKDGASYWVARRVG